jgi:CubicO group peptidase (beta-lactamase class C family)
MSRRRFGGLVGAGALTAAAPGLLGASRLGAQPAEPTWSLSGRRGAGLAAFDHAMRDFMQARDVSCGQLAVVYRRRLVLARGYTWSADDGLETEPTSLFRIASLSKPITAAAVTRLVQDRQVGLDDPVADVVGLTPLPGQSLDRRIGQVTVRRLLQHLGGWDRAVTADPIFQDRLVHDRFGLPLPLTRGQLISYGAGIPLDHDPGTTYAYANYGYVLLTQLVRAVSGIDYTAYVEREVLDPVDVTRMKRARSLEDQRQAHEVHYVSQQRATTVFDDEPVQVPAPYGSFNVENMVGGGGWLASAVDYVRFAQIFDGGTSVLDDASLDEVLARPEVAGAGDTSWYGFGWHVAEVSAGRLQTFHSGTMSGTFSIVTRRSDGITWAALFNQRDDPSGLAYGYDDIASPLHAAANAMTSWPTVDYFPEFF